MYIYTQVAFQTIVEQHDLRFAAAITKFERQIAQQTEEAASMGADVGGATIHNSLRLARRWGRVASGWLRLNARHTSAVAAHDAYTSTDNFFKKLERTVSAKIYRRQKSKKSKWGKVRGAVYIGAMGGGRGDSALDPKTPQRTELQESVSQSGATFCDTFHATGPEAANVSVTACLATVPVAGNLQMRDVGGAMPAPPAPACLSAHTGAAGAGSDAHEEAAWRRLLRVEGMLGQLLSRMDGVDMLALSRVLARVEVHLDNLDPRQATPVEGASLAAPPQELAHLGRST